MRLPLFLLFLGSVSAVVAAVPDTTPGPERPATSFEQVLAQRCGQCHTRERIDQARRRGAEAGTVLQRMEGQGVRLSPQERSTLSAFWGSPLKSEKPTEPGRDASAYRTLIETRCLQCHTRERIDQAIARQLSLQSLEALLARRGVTLNLRESEVLKAFWGEPLR